MADITFERSSFSRAWKSAIWASTRSRNPPVSPACTIAVYTRGKVSGDLPIESARDVPSITRSWIPFHFSLAAGEEDSL